MDTPPPSPAPTPAAALDPAAVVADIAGTAAASMPAPSAPPPTAPAPRPAPPTAGPVLTDGGGLVFDPAKHKRYPDGTPFINRNGRFMPIGGRKGTPPAPAPVSPAAAPVAPPPPDPAAAKAWSATDRATAAEEKDEGGNLKSENRPENRPPDDGGRGEDARLAPEQGGELMARCLYTATGALTGDHATANASGAEHANLVKTFTAFMRYRGYTVTGWGALGFSVLAFLFDEKRRAVVSTRLRALLFGPPAPPKEERRAQPMPAPAGEATPARAQVVPPMPPAAPPAAADPRRAWLNGLAEG